MATDTLSDSRPSELNVPAIDFSAILKRTVSILASLRLTVALFAMAIFIVFVGTFAQDEESMWQVMSNYFRPPVSRIELQVFFPKPWFPNFQNVPGWFWFPGGLSIGVAMAINLIAAHVVRFKIQAKGLRLAFGLTIIALGCLVTAVVIASGHDTDGVQGDAFISWDALWFLLKFALTVVCVAGAVTLFWQARRMTHLALWGLSATTVALAALTTWLWIEGEAVQLNDSGMRILWQLIQASIAAVVLLIGSVLVFRKRGGIVLIHGGVLLMMFGELWVGMTAVEERISMYEGETVNFARDIREVELAIVDSSDPDEERVLVVPGSMLKEGETLEVDAHGTPLRIEVLEHYRNANLRALKPGEENLATRGRGTTVIAEQVRAGSGADAGGEVDLAAAYLRFTDLDSDDEIGTFLLSQMFSGVSTWGEYEELPLDDRTLNMALRFKRTYKPYAVNLLEVRKDDYVGTSTPRSYSSTVRLTDAGRNMDSEFKIWMNNPLRYAGETFYQSGYSEDQAGNKRTDLQVVTNSGWMIPYVSCMIVVYGLFAHFGIVFHRFLRRLDAGEYSYSLDDPAPVPTAELADQPSATDRKGKRKASRGSARTPPRRTGSTPTWRTKATWIVPCVATAVVALMIVARAYRAQPVEKTDGMDLDAFGRLPVMYEGRVKPMDTLARNNLRVISNRDYYVDEDGDRQPAIRWLLDVIESPEAAAKHKVFRIENLDVLQTFGLERRKGFRYSVEELMEKIGNFEQEAAAARRLDPLQRSFYQKKLLETERRIQTFTKLSAAFRPPALPPLPSFEEIQNDPDAARVKYQRFAAAKAEAERQLLAINPPLAVPMEEADGVQWRPYSSALVTAYLNKQFMVADVDENVAAFNSIIAAYSNDETNEFNGEVARYQNRLRSEEPEEYDPGQVGFEWYFNHLNPFLTCGVLYLCGILAVLLSWLSIPFSLTTFRILNRTVLGIVAVTFIVHTWAIVARIMISGRPPITNLYSSAVYIGWGGVLLGILIEALIVRVGVGNMLAGVAGFFTLLIAGGLAGDGDTFTVMQAVLDTQFWLSTHVVCITSGYFATFAAGFLAIVYILAGIFLPLPRDFRRILHSLTYGVVCFALFFSFFGTVLGGLWADDSWGRFWGWDPKENGALMIVLWNALVLHARWCGLVRERGFAVLVVGGNIMTAWSWFGVNELGIGLHSYGFTEGVLFRLGLFILSQLLIIGIGMLPRSLWQSFRLDDAHRSVATKPS